MNLWIDEKFTTTDTVGFATPYQEGSEPSSVIRISRRKWIVDGRPLEIEIEIKAVDPVG